MKKELSHYLSRRYPDFFENKMDSQSVSTMSWGFECDDGWFIILNNACSLIESYIKSIKDNNKFRLEMKEKIENGQEVHEHWRKEYELNKLEPKLIPSFQAIQIKEKFGTLRFYYSGGDEYISGIINFAENMSGEICEVCGNKGKLRNGSWIKTLCDEHNKYKEENEPFKLGDTIYALSDGCHKKFIIKEHHVDGYLAKEKIEWSDEKYNNFSKESEETYILKKNENDLFSYYEALIL